MAIYNYISQSIQSSCLIEAKDIDSFYYPITQNHTGYAVDGTLYSNGVQVQTPVVTSPPTSPPVTSPVYASWFTEGQSPYRGALQNFPQTGLVLLSQVALTIMDGSTPTLTLWMQALIQDNFALGNNFNSALNGWTPTGLVYADGVISVICTPDYGNKNGVDGSTYDIASNKIIHFDFVQDSIYFDVALNSLVS